MITFFIFYFFISSSSSSSISFGSSAISLRFNLASKGDKILVPHCSLTRPKEEPSLLTTCRVTLCLLVDRERRGICNRTVCIVLIALRQGGKKI